MTNTSMGKKILDIKRILEDNNRNAVTIADKSDQRFERLLVSFRRADIFDYQLEEIKKKTGLHLFHIHYWNEPDFCKKWKQMPKYMERYTDGQHVELMFTKDLRR